MAPPPPRGLDAKTEARVRTALQDAAGRALADNSLYIALYCHHEPPSRPSDFHWTLYHHIDSEAGGYKYHISNLGTGGNWIAAHGHTATIMREFHLCGLLRVAEVPDELKEDLNRIVRSRDEELASSADGSRIGCRSWTLDILQLLANQDYWGRRNVLACLDVGELEIEALDFGNEVCAGACENEQPRPVRDSRFVVKL